MLYKIYANLVEQGIVYIFFLLFGAFFKSIIVVLFNYFNSKKILRDLQESYRIKKILQKEEYTRFATGADRVIVTQLHNGEKFYGGRSMHKLSLVSGLSLESPYGKIPTKTFDKILNGILITHLNDILTIASSHKNYDIVSVKDLPHDFIYKDELKTDRISYLVVVKIPSGSNILGYMFYIYLDDNMPSFNKDNMNLLQSLGVEIGEVIK